MASKSLIMRGDYYDNPKVFGNLNFEFLSSRKENTLLLDTSSDLEPTENRAGNFDMILKSKYDHDSNAFYIYGGLACLKGPLSEEGIVKLLYGHKNEITFYLLNRYMIHSKEEIMPERFITTFNNINQIYRHCANLPQHIESKIYGLNNNGHLVFLHPPCIVEYVSGAYDFDTDNKSKVKLLEVEVNKGLQLLEFFNKLSEDLFFNHGNDLFDVNISSILTKLSESVLNKELNLFIESNNSFRNSLKYGVIESELELIFARPLSTEIFMERLKRLIWMKEHPKEFQDEVENGIMELEDFHF